MPVTMPGSAIGSTISRFSDSRPKNLKRCTASAASVPSTSATSVAPVAVFRLTIKRVAGAGAVHRRLPPVAA